MVNENGASEAPLQEVEHAADSPCPLALAFHKVSSRPDVVPRLTFDERQKLVRAANSSKQLGTHRTRVPTREPPQGSLEDVLLSRTSCRAFDERAIPREAFEDILQFAAGVNERRRVGPYAYRAQPSAGGLYPIELYLAVRRVEGLEPGLYHFCASGSFLEWLGSLPEEDFFRATVPSSTTRSPPAIVLFMVADLAKAAAKYSELAYRTCLLECGHIGQSLLLLATARGIGSCSIARCAEDAWLPLLWLGDSSDRILYLIELGLASP